MKRSLPGKLRLSRENDLYELFVGSLEIGEHANEFQHGVVEILSFVDYNDEPLTPGALIDQDLIELGLQFEHSSLKVLNPQICKERTEKI